MKLINSQRISGDFKEKIYLNFTKATEHSKSFLSDIVIRTYQYLLAFLVNLIQDINWCKKGN